MQQCHSKTNSFMQKNPPVNINFAITLLPYCVITGSSEFCKMVPIACEKEKASQEVGWAVKGREGGGWGERSAHEAAVPHSKDQNCRRRKLLSKCTLGQRTGSSGFASERVFFEWESLSWPWSSQVPDLENPLVRN